MSTWLALLLIVAAAAVSAVVCGMIFYRRGYNDRKTKAEAQIGSAEQEAERILEDAKKTADFWA